jgi:hypothetical protein
MVMEKISVQQAKALIDNSVGTIYSKDDVLAILNRIENFTAYEPSEPIINITPEQYSKLASKIALEVSNAIESMECVRGWDLSLDYNEVNVDSLDVNEVEVEEIVEEVINKWVIGIKEDDDCDC